MAAEDFLSMRNKQENSDILQWGTFSHHRTAEMPPLNYVNFTSTSENVICQRCKVLYPEGVELHFLHDLTGEGPGKKARGHRPENPGPGGGR